jgi:hypothetical protein
MLRKCQGFDEWETVQLSIKGKSTKCLVCRPPKICLFCRNFEECSRLHLRGKRPVGMVRVNEAEKIVEELYLRVSKEQN